MKINTTISINHAALKKDADQAFKKWLKKTETKIKKEKEEDSFFKKFLFGMVSEKEIKDHYKWVYER